jgi:hypothetical protein
MSQLVLVNPSDKSWTRHRYVLSFGAVGTTHLLVWGNGLDDALEEAAEYLADNAPGHIMRHDSDELGELLNEAMGELYPQYDSFEALTSELQWACEEKATADLTHTEAGYLTSYEWFVTLEDPTRAELKAFIASLEARHYSDEPVVKVA